MVTWVTRVKPAARSALIEAARQSVSLQPDRADGWVSLGILLNEAGRYEETVAALSDGVSRLPAQPELFRLLAHAHRKKGALDAALDALEIAFQLAPQHPATALSRFDLFVETSAWDRVAQYLDEAAAVAPTRQSVIRARAHFARSDGEHEAVLAACDAVLQKNPGHTEVLHRKAVALSMLGRDAEARAIIGLDRFICLGDLAIRHERIGGVAFLDMLAAEIRRNPTLEPDPYRKATRDGLQTRVLLQASDRAVPLLLEEIKRAVERYIEALPELPHPFTATKPDRLELSAWAVVYPPEGRQTSHLHPSGWISGVTYVAAPRVAGADRYGGPLVLGEIDSDRYSDPPPWGTREVEPVPGRIVLFPSFVPHATRATGVAGERICVAFDAAPA